MSSIEDDVRLPFSTLDPVMGDVIALHWEPETLQSMGQTMNLLATEVHAIRKKLLISDPHAVIATGVGPDGVGSVNQFHPMASHVDETVLSYRQPVVNVS